MLFSGTTVALCHYATPDSVSYRSEALVHKLHAEPLEMIIGLELISIPICLWMLALDTDKPYGRLSHQFL